MLETEGPVSPEAVAAFDAGFAEGYAEPSYLLGDRTAANGLAGTYGDLVYIDDHPVRVLARILGQQAGRTQRALEQLAAKNGSAVVIVMRTLEARNGDRPSLRWYIDIEERADA